MAFKKPLKPAEPPPIAKTPAKEPPQRSERVRPIKPAARASDRTPWSEGAPEARGGRNLSGHKLDLASGTAREGEKNSDGGFEERTTAVALNAPARPAAGLRPLPGNPPPRYPPLARQRGIEGRVLLRLTVNASGGVEAVSVAQSSGDALLDQEARQTVARWRFHPPGLTQAVAHIPIAFRLKD